MFSFFDYVADPAVQISISGPRTLYLILILFLLQAVHEDDSALLHHLDLQVILVDVDVLHPVHCLAVTGVLGDLFFAPKYYPN